MTRRGILFVVILLLLGAGAVLASIRVLATEKVFYLEPESPGANPFTPAAVFTSDSPPAPAPIDPSVTITTPPSPITPGDNPGPVGGNATRGECDPELLIQYLNENPERRAAWIAVQEVLDGEFEDYVRAATPALLTRDTRVTMQGFQDGGAVDMQAILAAGTAVLVDENDEIAVRCYSGSPLDPPQPMDRYRCEGCPADLPPPPACAQSCYDVPVESEAGATTTSTSAVTSAPASSTTTTTTRPPASTSAPARRRNRAAPVTRRAVNPPATTRPATSGGGAAPTIDPNFFSTQPRTFAPAAPPPPTTQPPTNPPTQPTFGPTAPTIPPSTFPQQTSTQPTTQPQAGGDCGVLGLECVV